jgi:hypothetical protein
MASYLAQSAIEEIREEGYALAQEQILGSVEHSLRTVFAGNPEFVFDLMSTIVSNIENCGQSFMSRPTLLNFTNIENQTVNNFGSQFDAHHTWAPTQTREFEMQPPAAPRKAPMKKHAKKQMPSSPSKFSACKPCIFKCRRMTRDKSEACCSKCMEIVAGLAPRCRVSGCDSRASLKVGQVNLKNYGDAYRVTMEDYRQCCKLHKTQESEMVARFAPNN